MLNRNEALKLLGKADERLFGHVVVVNKVANYMAKKLVSKGIKINLELVNIASLLHDVGRIKSGPNHNNVGADMLKELGEDAIALLIQNHDQYSFRELTDWECKIVNWADKRVKFDKVVSLKYRFVDGLARYPEEEDILRETLPLYEEFEDEIFGIIEENKELESLKNSD